MFLIFRSSQTSQIVVDFPYVPNFLDFPDFHVFPNLHDFPDFQNGVDFTIRIVFVAVCFDGKLRQISADQALTAL